MALKELTLFGEVDRVEIAINRIKRYEPPEGYYLAFSGGKDSVVIYELAKMSGVKFDAHYNNTTIDPPELVHFIRKYYPDVQEHRPKYSFRKLLLKHSSFPLRHSRFCCEYLKEYGGIGRLVMTGIRWQESSRRKSRKLFEKSKRYNKTFLHPIIDWDTSEIWEFIKKFNLPYCSLYDNGFARIGCVLCPMQTVANKKRDIERYPKQAENIKRVFVALYDKYNYRPSYRRWKSGEEMFDWWISGKRIEESNNDLFIN